MISIPEIISNSAGVLFLAMLALQAGLVIRPAVDLAFCRDARYAGMGVALLGGVYTVAALITGLVSLVFDYSPWKLTAYLVGMTASLVLPAYGTPFFLKIGLRRFKL